jgi:hypothetical protein
LTAKTYFSFPRPPFRTNSHATRFTSIDRYEEKPIPSGFNWDLHLNQSEWRPFGSGATRDRNYVGGQMTNWGAHGVDQIQWALGKDDIKAMPLQGRIGHKTPFPITITSSWASSRA